MWLCLLLCNYKIILKHKAGSFFCLFRWIQLSWFLYSLDSTCFSVFANFLVVMWLCLLLCNYKMFLKHKVGCLFSFFRWIQLSWFLYSLDSICSGLFACVLVDMWHCLLLCNYKMLKYWTDFCVHQSFSAFENYLNRKLRLAQVSLDSIVLISIFAGFNMF